MEYTKEDIKRLREYKFEIDDDNIRIKERIKRLLLSNKDIIHVLNNKELEDADAEPDDYYGLNIIPGYIIKPIQSNVQNYICFVCDFDELEKYNKTIKYQNIVFHVLCEQKNLIDKDTGIARHDLLGALIKKQFNWTTYFGERIHCVSDKEIIIDNNFVGRTITFEMITDNNIVKTKNGIPQLITKDIQRSVEY